MFEFFSKQLWLFTEETREEMASDPKTDFIPDLPSGPLDEYRKQASFNWKKLKLVFEKADLLKIKVDSYKCVIT